MEARLSTLLQSGRDIEQLVCDLGLDLNKMPASFTECFKTRTKEEAKILSGAASALSRVITTSLPKSLEGMTARDVLTHVHSAGDGKIFKTSLFQKAREIADDGLGRAIAFQIVRKHPDAANSPFLRSLRQRIEANSAMVKASVKGGRKGGNPEPVIDAAVEGNKRYNVYHSWERNMMLAYIAEMAIGHGDTKAFEVLQNLFSPVSQMPLLAEMN